MPYYRKVAVDYLQPEEKFICKLCSKEIAAFRRHKMRYKVRFKMIDGKEKHLCIKCATNVTNRPKKQFLKQARHLYLVR